MAGKNIDHFFTSDKAVVDLYRDHDRDVTTMRVSAETGRISASGYDETMTFEIEAHSYNAWASGTGLPTMVSRDNLDPVDAVEDIEDEDDRFLAESIYRFLKDNPIQKVNGHALTELVRSLGWVPGDVVSTLETEKDDLEKRVEKQQQYIKELQQKIISRQEAEEAEEEEFLPEPDPDDEFSNEDLDLFHDILDDEIDDPDPELEFDEVTEKSLDGSVERTFKVPRTRLHFDEELWTDLQKRIEDHERRVEEMVTREDRKKQRREAGRTSKPSWWAK